MDAATAGLAQAHRQLADAVFAQSLALDERLAQHLRHHVVLSAAEVGRLVVVELVAHQHVLQQVGACRAAREGARAGWGGGRRDGALEAPERGGSSPEPKAAPSASRGGRERRRCRRGGARSTLRRALT